MKRTLSESLESYHSSVQQWNTARQTALSVPTTTCLPELQDTSLRLRNEMDDLRKKCAAAAVRVCEWQVRNQERGKNLAAPVHGLVSHLHRLEDSVTGTLELQIRRQEERNRRMRFQWALTAFWMHRVEVKDIPESGQEVAGIGKIGGLPLPHVGSELFGVLPPEELQSALRLVAVLTFTVAQCLAISLPHPIVLDGRMDDRVDIAAATSNTTTPTTLPRQQLIPLSTSAVLRESRDRSSQPYALVFANNDEFTTAWQFLQNNTIALSIRAGVPVGKLFPGEAVLLNLHALQEYCQEQTVPTAAQSVTVATSVDDTNEADASAKDPS